MINGRRHIGVRPRLPMRAKPFDKRVVIEQRVQDGYQGRFEHLVLIHSISLENDARWWHHVSVSRDDSQMPTYEDLQLAKLLCLGPNRAAVELFPKESEHMDPAGDGSLGGVKQVRHLWSCKKMPLPDFTHGGVGL